MTHPPDIIQHEEELREIKSILLFRYDLAPFLVHLTRKTDNSARDNLESILKSMTLRYGNEPFSAASFALNPYEYDDEFKSEFFNAISFTETPIGEIHNLLNIADRKTQLSDYGLVFNKSKLSAKGVSPTIYINNEKGDKDHVIAALCSLIDNHREAAKQILPLVAGFGKYFKPVVGKSRDDRIDFTWEREWRFVSETKTFHFAKEDVFIGLCPHEEIAEFESKFDWVKFIDPKRNVKWYAEKLVTRRREYGLENSVV